MKDSERWKKQREQGRESYNFLNVCFSDDEQFSFMNHGYFPIHKNCSNLLLDSSASLYCFILDKIDNSKNKRILDIGCGRGGGANLIKKMYDFSEVHACDFNQKNIEFCMRAFDGIQFEQDNAETLEKYKNTSKFDAILNVESSHCYDHKDKFFSSVKKILKDDGVFFYADIFDVYSHENSINYIRDVEDLVKCDFEIVEKYDISQNSLLSCYHMIDKLSRFERNIKIDLVKSIYIQKKDLYLEGIHKFIIYELKKRV